MEQWLAYDWMMVWVSVMSLFERTWLRPCHVLLSTRTRKRISRICTLENKYLSSYWVSLWVENIYFSSGTLVSDPKFHTHCFRLVRWRQPESVIFNRQWSCTSPASNATNRASCTRERGWAPALLLNGKEGYRGCFQTGDCTTGRYTHEGEERHAERV